MPTLRGFTTKGKTGDEIMEELSATGVDVTLPISSDGPINVDKSPIKSKVKNKKGENLNIEVDKVKVEQKFKKKTREKKKK